MKSCGESFRVGGYIVVVKVEAAEVESFSHSFCYSFDLFACSWKKGSQR